VATIDGVVRHAALKRRLDEVTTALIKQSTREAKTLVGQLIDSELAYINSNIFRCLWLLCFLVV
jgi:hypothetical protein